MKQRCNNPLGIISKNTILKAIHNSKLQAYNIHELGIISKNTILKAIHNMMQEYLINH